ncbi:MAG: VOC family protein [Gordonia sp. (in: high G+C Gram-positive bacteria)]|uniref:VOC family protein n=1 Tax=Gordonia TaxID=2053 RepID=UPI00326647F6
MSRRVERRRVDHCRVDHCGLVVSDLDDAVDFFRTHLGAQVSFGMERFVDPTGAAPRRLGAATGSFALTMLTLGDARVELLQWWDGDGRPITDTGTARRPDRVGAAHLGIVVPDVSAALEPLRSVEAATILSEPVTFDSAATPGLTNAFVWTRFGVLLELMAWPATDDPGGDAGSTD